MSHCPNCGNKFNPADVLCTRCGSLIEKVQPSAYAQPAECEKESGPSPAVPPGANSVFIPPEHYAPLFCDDGFSENMPAPPDAPLPVPAADETVAPEKQWLEIEELDAPTGLPVPEPSEAAGPAEAPPEPDTQAQSANAQPAEQPDAGVRRYRDRPAPSAPPVSPPPKPRKPAEKKRTPAIVVLLLWLLAVAAVFAGLYFANAYITENYGGWPAFVRALTDEKVDLDTSADYATSISVNVSEAQTEDGAPAHQFDVSMPDGRSVRVLPLGDSYPMVGGKASFTVADEALARSLGIVTAETTMETSGVNLEIETASQPLSYPVTSLTLRLQEAQYSREKPADNALTTTAASQTIALILSADATVFINNVNHSSGIDEFGHLSLSLPLELGENLFVIETVQPGRQSVKESFTVTRNLPNTSLTLRDTYLRVFDASFECRGSTAPGAAVTAVLDGQKFTALVGDDGTFSVVCTLEARGLYQMNVTASKEEYSDVQSSVLVEYLPAQTTFMEAAKTMTVDKIAKGMKTLGKTGIKVKATIDGNIAPEGHKQKFDVKSDGATMSCYFFGAEHLSAELEYIFYGVVDPETNSFYVMFVE